VGAKLENRCPVLPNCGNVARSSGVLGKVETCVLMWNLTVREGKYYFQNVTKEFKTLESQACLWIFMLGTSCEVFSSWICRDIVKGS
jgi:hypothetical protein